MIVNIRVQFTDATPTSTSYYQLQWRVGSGTPTLVSNLGLSPASSLTYTLAIDVNSGDAITVQTRAVYGTTAYDIVYGDWSSWSSVWYVPQAYVPLIGVVVAPYAPRVGRSAKVFPTAVSVVVSTRTPTIRVSRYSRPVEDLSDGAWLASIGSDLYAMLDEPSYSDTDYIYTDTSGTSCTLRLSQVENPAPIDTTHVLRYRGQGLFTVSLYCGATEVASWTEDLSSLTTVERELSSGEKALITDYDNLRVVLET